MDLAGQDPVIMVLQVGPSKNLHGVSTKLLFHEE